MKHLIAAALGLAFAVAAYAACTTTTIYSGGKMITCTTCCYGPNCTVNCF